MYGTRDVGFCEREAFSVCERVVVSLRMRSRGGLRLLLQRRIRETRVLSGLEGVADVQILAYRPLEYLVEYVRQAGLTNT